MQTKKIKLKKFNFDSAKNQRGRLLKYLELYRSITVGEARNLLGIMSPPSRVLELRRANILIETHFKDEIDALGVKHRNGVYVLRGRKST